ncbi:ribosomal N-lysine methyltransferase [Aspergillus homomorphus CBS 101889]|uniref:Ribosomal N-lysine methyltransferase n=1 Tax=Aspergillus homomorphus (strain CBS 101889) TaxID=1450537 RepID=A0A395I481_ASPHC|nr:ribosomal N-lysine methyltransferase [Aspergillus homomorphus CBS 101889]RAL14890.1 ribosomal N-lysine methyltransferase [Aspergillus homomorphus CBS 101889]
MATDESPGAEHAAFMQWAQAQGVSINGIAPARFPGRRLGMKATRTIEENEIMLNVPVSAMLTIDSIPSAFVAQFPSGTSIHCILAAFLAHGDTSLLEELDPWRKVWPEYREFEDTMPVLWPEHLRRSNSAFESTANDNQSSNSNSSSGSPSAPYLLPPSISGLWNTFEKEPVGVDYETRYQNLLTQQERRLRTAWAHALKVYPETDWDTFAYYWFIINSRSFYYVSPGKDEPEDWNDAIAMVPFADYFNHVDDAACEVIWTGQNYLFKATRQYEQGEEIYMSYGSHSNDFLFVEYGFFLPTNPSDSIYLDDIIFQDLTLEQKKDLAAQDLFGNFELTLPQPTSSPKISTSTPTPLEAAAALKTMTRRDWKLWLSGRSQRGFSAEKSAEVKRGWIEVYHWESEMVIARIERILVDDSECHNPVGGVVSNGGEARKDGGGASSSSDGDKKEKGRMGSAAWERGRLEMLVERWRQVRGLCEGALEGL